MSIFMVILFGMIFALAILSNNFMSFTNKLTANILMIFEKTSTKLLVLKNLIAHRDRNGATALMFSLILAFIIFLSIVCKIPNSRQFYEEKHVFRVFYLSYLKILL